VGHFCFDVLFLFWKVELKDGLTLRGQNVIPRRNVSLDIVYAERMSDALHLEVSALNM